jgi:hypothetical protein
MTDLQRLANLSRIATASRKLVTYSGADNRTAAQIEQSKVSTWVTKWSDWEVEENGVLSRRIWCEESRD